MHLSSHLGIMNDIRAGVHPLTAKIMRKLDHGTAEHMSRRIFTAVRPEALNISDRKNFRTADCLEAIGELADEKVLGVYLMTIWDTNDPKFFKIYIGDAAAQRRDYKKLWGLAKRKNEHEAMILN